MKRQIVVITKKGRVLRAMLENLSEKEVSTKILSFKVEDRDEVVAMQIVEL